MLVVGLTGGIGSGKSAVSAAFEKRGVPVIDTDILARQLVAPGQPALQEIITAFGPDCVDGNGCLDRSYLRRVVFADTAKRKRLENILHPRIRRKAQEIMASITAPYCLVVVPLLVETNALTGLVQRILVVDVPETVQQQRVMERDQVDETLARRILSAQVSRSERLAHADDVINNEGTLKDLESTVTALHEKYLSLAEIV